MTGFKLRMGFLALVFAVILVAGGVWAWNNSPPVGGLRSFDPAARSEEATALAERRRDDPTADDALIAVLSDPSESVRGAAADTLGKRGAVKAEKALAESLKDPAPSVRAAAANALGRFPSLEPATLTALLACFKDQAPFVRKNVFGAVEARARAAKEPDDPRLKAFQPHVLAGASDAAAQVRMAVASALRNPPKGSILDADAVIVAHAGLLDDRDSNVQFVAVGGLTPLMKAVGPKLGEPTLKVLCEKLPSLVKGIIDGDRDTRPLYQGAVVAIGGVARTSGFHADSASAEKIRGAIDAALKYPSPEVRMAAIPAFSAIVSLMGADEKSVDQTLRTGLDDPATQDTSIRTLRAALDPGASGDAQAVKRAVELLRPLLKAPSPIVRSSVYTAFWSSPAALKVGGDPIRAELREMTRGWMVELKEGKKAESRDVSAWCLAWTEPDTADPAMAALTAALKDSEPLVAEQAQKSLDSLKAAKGKPAWPDASWKPFRRRGRGGF